MRLIEIIGKEGIIPKLRARNRDEAFMEMVDVLVSSGRVDEEQREDILMALFKREALGATNIAPGVAIPHIKTELVQEFVGVLGRSQDGIVFEPEEPPVNVIFLFLSPVRAVSGHLRLLAHIGGILNHDGYVKLLREAVCMADLQGLVEDAERMIFGEQGTPPDEDGTPVPIL